MTTPKKKETPANEQEQTPPRRTGTEPGKKEQQQPAKPSRWDDKDLDEVLGDD